MTDKRVNFITIIIGTRGTGKTTYFKGDEKLKIDGIIDIYLDKDPKQKILIVDLFDNPVWRDIPLITTEKLARWKSGVYRIYNNNSSELMRIINKHCYNTVIFFEDATKYVNSNIDSNLNRLLIDSKQKNCDIFFAFHYLMAVPPDLVRVSDYMIIFKTNETFTSHYKNKFPHPDIQKAFNDVAKSENFHINKSVQLI